MKRVAGFRVMRWAHSSAARKPNTVSPPRELDRDQTQTMVADPKEPDVLVQTAREFAAGLRKQEQSAEKRRADDEACSAGAKTGGEQAAACERKTTDWTVDMVKKDPTKVDQKLKKQESPNKPQVEPEKQQSG